MRSPRFVPIIFAIIGIGAMIFAIYLSSNTRKFLVTSIEAEGTVQRLVQKRSDDGSLLYSPVVTFETKNGEQIEFQSRSASNPPSVRKGEAVRVAYDPASPQNARINSFMSLWFLPLIFGGLGFLFAVIGIGIMGYRFWKKKRANHLKQTGLPVQADVTDVIFNTSIKMNGRSPYNIYAQYDEAGSVYTFKSNNIWFDPNEFVEKDSKVTVYVDPQDKTIYHMDLSFLPKHKY